ncbi:MAG: ribosome small subunit-dependent GTPase A [Prevotella sp.]|nr:ribosome small subunit-dependent GTPase A [Prevotella sp.]
MHGIVVKNTGSWYVVRRSDGRRVHCKLKGTFRLAGIHSTNPVAVGDVVDAVLTPDGTGLITSIADRRNYIVRRSQNLSRQSHIIAANVDLALLLVTVIRPQTSLVFVDRFLASAEAYSVPVVLVFNKIDLFGAEERELLDGMMYLYDNIGYRCVALSAVTGQGADTLLPRLAGKITLLSGNSGTGKSTLINRLVPGASLPTGEVSAAHDRGKHTTTFSEMIEFDVEGQTSMLIDTPGIKGFGNFDMRPEEISRYFKEIFRFSKDCRFRNCTHTHEPGCAVLRALQDHYIAESRYSSYISMISEKDDDKYRAPY